MTANGMVTIGVAIAVPPPFGGDLQRRRAEFGDPFAGDIPAHVTLLPPTPVDAARLDDVHAHLGAVAAGQKAFNMRLRGTGTFRPVSPVVFVQVAEGIAECERIERAVRSGLLSRETAFNYHPHVTVAHQLPPADLDRAFGGLAGYEATFAVAGFDLYEHGADGVWRPRRHFGFAQSRDGYRTGAR